MKLRHEDPEDKLSALVTSQHVHFIKAGLPLAENVVLTVKLFNLYKARHKDQGMWCVRYFRAATRGIVRQWSGKKTLFKVREESRSFSLSQGNLTFWRKVRRCWHNLRHDLMNLKTGRKMWVGCDLNDAFPSSWRKICWKCISLHGRLETTTKSGILSLWSGKSSWKMIYVAHHVSGNFENWYLGHKVTGMKFSKMKQTNKQIEKKKPLFFFRSRALPGITDANIRRQTTFPPLP